MTNTANDDHELIAMALNHAWSWYQTAMSHRMQLANIFFFIIAGYAASYVAAMQAHLPLVGGGVGIVAAISIGVCSLTARRARERVAAADGALQEIQSRLARLVDIDELNIIERINTSRPAWRLTAVQVGFLMGLLATAFLAAGIYGFVQA